jgi:hypothetical protein
MSTPAEPSKVGDAIARYQADHPHPMGVNMVVNFFAAVVFAVLMCVFWWFAASQEMVHAVGRKAKVLYTTRRKLEEEPLLRDLATVLDAKMYQAEKEIGAAAPDAEAYRMAQNRHLLFMWMGPMIAVYGGLLLGAIVYNQTRTHYAESPNHHLTFGHWAGLLLVFFSYIPEIMFFLFVIEWMVPMGDYEITERLCGFKKA